MEVETIKHMGKWAGAILGGAVLLLLLGVGAILLFLQTQYGRDRVTGLVEDFTQGTSYRVRIEGFGGAPPWRVELGRVEISDREGVWLTLEEVMVRWDVGDLFKRLYHFPLIQAERAHWQRLPRGEARDEQPRAEEEPLSIPDMPSVIVSELRLQLVSIDEEVFGRAQELSVDGRLDADGNLSRAQLTIEGTDGAGDNLVVKVEHNPETDRLFVRFRVREEPGGLVGGLLGLDDSGPILALVRGEGPLEDWRGVFKLSVGGYGETEGEVRMSLPRALSLSLSGRAVVEEQRLPADAAALFGDAADFRVTLSRTADTLRLEEGVVKAGPVDLSMNGTMALEVQSLDVQINVTFEEIPGAVTKRLEERGIRLEEPGPVKGSIRGSLRQPEIEVDLTAARLAIDRADLVRPRIVLQGQLLRADERESTGFAGTARVRAAQLLIPELPKLSPVEGMLKLSTPDFEFFEIPQVTLSSPGLDVTGSGTLHREGWRTEGTIDVRISDPDKLLELGGAAVPERLHMRAGIKGALAPPDFRLAVQATASEFGRWPEAVRAITGEQLSLSTEGTFARSVIEVSDFVLTGKAVGLRGSGQADLEQGRFSVVSQGALQDLSLLPGRFEGALTVEADASGPVRWICREGHGTGH
jgi:autotransporter translocation and assembly factor TamB